MLGPGWVVGCGVRAEQFGEFPFGAVDFDFEVKSVVAGFGFVAADLFAAGCGDRDEFSVVGEGDVFDGAVVYVEGVGAGCPVAEGVFGVAEHSGLGGFVAVVVFACAAHFVDHDDSAVRHEVVNVCALKCSVVEDGLDAIAVGLDDSFGEIHRSLCFLAWLWCSLQAQNDAAVLTVVPDAECDEVGSSDGSVVAVMCSGVGVESGWRFVDEFFGFGVFVFPGDLAGLVVGDFDWFRSGVCGSYDCAVSVDCPVEAWLG